MLSKIINIGDRPHLPDFIRNRIQSTNLVTLCLMALIALPFFLISLYYAPFLAFIPGLGIITCLVVLVANYFGLIKWSRFFISALPVWEVISYNAYLTEPGNPPVSNLYLIAVSFIIVPFVIIDRWEKWFLGLTALFCSCAIIFFPQLAYWLQLTSSQMLEVQEYMDLLQHGWLSTLTAVLAILAAFSSMWGLIEINRQAEERLIVSHQEIEAYNNQLLQEKLDNEQKANALQRAQENEKKQQWINEGVNRISEVIRSYNNEKQEGSDQSIFDAVLVEIVKYLNANQGGVYVVDKVEQTKDRTNGDATSIRLVACYAYERKKYVSQSLSPGEGLLGQAYLEKVPSYITNVPEKYARISSGLGKARPRCLAIVPFVINGVVEGLVELASFAPLEEHQCAFIEKAGEVVGAFIQSNRSVQDMESLLYQAQEQAEILSAQEEEIRQSMEEMQATQENHERMMREMKEERDLLLAKIESLEAADTQ